LRIDGTDVGNDTDDLPRSIVEELDRDRLPDWIFIRPVPPRHRLVDERHWRARRRVEIAELAAADDGSLQHLEVVCPNRVPCSAQRVAFRRGRLPARNRKRVQASAGQRPRI
jgi:hypothetical protein